MIKALIFDYYDVMVDDVYWHSLVERAHNDGKTNELHAIQSGLNSGEISWNSFCKKAAAIMGTTADEVVMEYDKAPLNTELVALILSLKTTYVVALLSNAGHEQLTHQLQKHAIDTLFNYVGISSDFKLMKPEQELFKQFAARMSVKPEECVMVDDNPENVEGAKRAGLQAIQFINNEQLQSELREYL